MNVLLDDLRQNDRQSEYETECRVYVRGIELDAKWLRRSAENLKHHAKMLRAVPGTSSEPADQLTSAELALEQALHEVHETKKLFEGCE